MNRARICSHCGALSSPRAGHCSSCGKRFLPPVLHKGWHVLTLALGSQAPVTKILFGLCGVQYLLMSLDTGLSVMGNLTLADVLRWGGLVRLPQAELGGSEPWRYLSAVFAHAGVLHFGMNMLALGSIGPGLESKVGPARLALIFVVSGALGFVVSDLWGQLSAPLEVRATLGASGAIFGILGAGAAAGAARRERAWKNHVGSVLVWALALTFLMPTGSISIDHSAHWGGLLFGGALGYMLGLDRRPWKREAFFRAAATIAILASIGSLVACQLSPQWKLQRQLEIQWGVDREG